MDLPAAVVLAGVQEAVVDAVFSALPELDGLRNDSVAAPERRRGDFFVGKFLFYIVPLDRQEFSRGDLLALRGRPSADLVAFWPRLEVLEGFFWQDFCGASMNNHLAFDGEPREQQGDVFVGGYMFGFAAFVVGEEEESFFVKALCQNGPRPRFAVWIDGGQSRGVWLQNIRLAGLVKP